VLASAVVLLPGLGTTPLVDWDESIYAAVGRGVLDGSALRLEWNGDPYHRKPPLLFWAIAASYELLGVNEFATRLPSALAGVATCAVVALAVARRAGAAAALLSTALLLGSTLFVERGGRRACTDALLILFTTVALWRATETSGTRSNAVQAGIAVGLAILSKGVAGILAPAALFLAAPFAASQRRRALEIAAVGALVALPWYAAQVWLEGSVFVASHLGYEVIERALRPIHGSGAPWTYPLSVLRENAGIWVAVVPVVVVLRCWSDRAARQAALPWLYAAVLTLAAAMSMQTKLPWYVLPALPMLAVAAGMSLVVGEHAARRSRTWLTGFAVLGLVAANAILLAAPARRTVLEDEMQFEPFRTLGSEIAALLSDEPFIGATQENPTLVFYGGRPIRVYPQDELNRLLLDPSMLPRAALIHEADALGFLDLGAQEIARFGDRVLVRYAPLDG